MKHIMESCVEISVPILSEVSIGPNWNDQSEDDYVKELERYELQAA